MGDQARRGPRRRDIGAPRDWPLFQFLGERGDRGVLGFDAPDLRRPVGAATEALLIERVILVVGACRRPAPRPDGAPVTALEDAGALALADGASPLIDVAGHVVDPERALAARLCAG